MLLFVILLVNLNFLQSDIVEVCESLDNQENKCLNKCYCSFCYFNSSIDTKCVYYSDIQGENGGCGPNATYRTNANQEICTESIGAFTMFFFVLTSMLIVTAILGGIYYLLVPIIYKLCPDCMNSCDNFFSEKMESCCYYIYGYRQPPETSNSFSDSDNYRI